MPTPSKRFLDPDLQAFAKVSSDRNPLHMDALVARRAFEGARVVHGVLVLLYGLDRLLPVRGRRPAPVKRIKCDFKKPVLMGERVEYRLPVPGGTRITALVDGVPCLEADWGLEPSAPAPQPFAGTGRTGLDALDSPLEWEQEGFSGFSAVLRVPLRPGLRALFPRLCRILSLAEISALVRLSYAVGMVCPGLYSLFSSLDVDLPGTRSSSDRLSLDVRSFDERFGRLEMRVEGALSGTLRAFRRPRPFQQPGMDKVRGWVAPGSFSTARALVIGGSRGLGELTAKLIGAGGGTVYLGYHQGEDDARRVAGQIGAGGSGACHPVRIDVLSAPSPAFLKVLGEINCLYYYPTPVIARKQSGLFDRRRFEEFIDFYVDRFYSLCRMIEERSPGKVQVFYPSTVFIDKRPNDMTAYAMAKAAAEVLVQDINRQFKKVGVLCERLPRLGTDQTNSILETQKEDGLATLLPIVQAIQDRLERSGDT